MEQTRTIEITETQYKHLKEVMAMDKPSKSRLTQDEKSMIVYLCKHYLEESLMDDEYTSLVGNIIKKLK